MVEKGHFWCNRIGGVDRRHLLHRQREVLKKKNIPLGLRGTVTDLKISGQWVQWNAVQVLV